MQVAHRAASERWMAKHPEQKEAANIVNNAVRDGRLIPRGLCALYQSAHRNRMRITLTTAIHSTWFGCDKHHKRSSRYRACRKTTGPAMSAITLFDAAASARGIVGQVDPETGELSESLPPTALICFAKGRACVAYAIDEQAPSAQWKPHLPRRRITSGHARHGWIDSTPICLIAWLRPAPTS